VCILRFSLFPYFALSRSAVTDCETELTLWLGWSTIARNWLRAVPWFRRLVAAFLRFGMGSIPGQLIRYLWQSGTWLEFSSRSLCLYHSARWSLTHSFVCTDAVWLCDTLTERNWVRLPQNRTRFTKSLFLKYFYHIYEVALQDFAVSLFHQILYSSNYIDTLTFENFQECMKSWKTRWDRCIHA
jgi:hypothetical protein